MHYRESGAADAPAVVLIHGLFGDLDNLGQLARHLANEFRVIALDMRNHGHSPHQASMSWDELSLDLLNLLDHLAIPCAHLVGHSLGGKLVMQFALRYPTRAVSLVVADMAPVSYTTPRHEAVFAALHAVEAQNASDRKQAETIMASWLPDTSVRQFLLKNYQIKATASLWRFNLAALHACYPQLMAWQAPEAQFRGPTLFIKGGLSDYLLPEHQATILALFPQARARIIPDAGHWLHAQKPQLFNKLVVDFLSISR
ncbi:MAG: alpha/beta fold hydrolase [Aeromonadaceae bacterium]